MEEFLAERIDVERGETSPDPVRFYWRGEAHEVREILHVRVDTGFGNLPPRSGRWYLRRHRRYYVVRDSQGRVFEIYLDYADRKRQTWWLVRESVGEDT